MPNRDKVQKATIPSVSIEDGKLIVTSDGTESSLPLNHPSFAERLRDILDADIFDRPREKDRIEGRKQALDLVIKRLMEQVALLEDIRDNYNA